MSGHDAASSNLAHASNQRHLLVAGFRVCALGCLHSVLELRGFVVQVLASGMGTAVACSGTLLLLLDLAAISLSSRASPVCRPGVS